MLLVRLNHTAEGGHRARHLPGCGRHEAREIVIQACQERDSTCRRPWVNGGEEFLPLSFCGVSGGSECSGARLKRQ